jgi:lysophospholipase L1-like esterase
MKKFLFPIYFFFTLNFLYGQLTEYPLYVKVPYFVDTASNVIENTSSGSKLDKFYQVLTSYVTKGEGRYNIVHFGGSHLQAAIYTSQFIKRLDENFYGIVRSTGYVFPFKIAKTNHPVYYRSNYTGEWKYCKNVKKKKSCYLGVGGIMAETTDSLTSITIYPVMMPQNFSFDKVSLLFEVKGSSRYTVIINGDTAVVDSSSNGIAVCKYETLQDSLFAVFRKMDSLPGKFVLYGFVLDKDAPGIMYSSIGINGAATYSFLKCERFEKDLKVLNPDLVILSLGTNDGYGKGYSDSIYYANIDSLVSKIRMVNPSCEIMLTVPNDVYYKRRYPNRNTQRQERTIKKIANDRNLMVWDLYKIMGGYGSSLIWYRAGLMKYDRIHFTPLGYRLKGDLFFSAFIKGYDVYLNERAKLTANGRH